MVKQKEPGAAVESMPHLSIWCYKLEELLSLRAPIRSNIFQLFSATDVYITEFGNHLLNKFYV
jgi:hypothetical protein